MPGDTTQTLKWRLSAMTKLGVQITLAVIAVYLISACIMQYTSNTSIMGYDTRAINDIFFGSLLAPVCAAGTAWAFYTFTKMTPGSYEIITS